MATDHACIRPLAEMNRLLGLLTVRALPTMNAQAGTAESALMQSRLEATLTQEQRDELERQMKARQEQMEQIQQQMQEQQQPE